MKKQVLKLKVIPNARKDQLGEQMGEYTKVYITAPPVDNKANKQLVLFLSRHFQVPKSSISIVQGKRSQYKVVEISH